MSDYQIGDLVVLISGSMRMAVEAVDDNMVACVWCNEGEIGRDNFDARLLKKWEYREDSGQGDRRGGRDDRGGDHRGGGKPYRGDREGGGKPYGKGDRGGDRDDRGGRGDRDSRGGGDRDKPRGKTGWDGKPREKKFFRKDD